ncbi:leucine-rich repeat protein [Perkinsela sp. CCAP 1560/4]|nr:leucine-rich repeat protein [Perkinsela sp. CCAP 1560/4]|eukprot:KNH04145.1 leucine-rich repeat protein [Perkinsela sp. CCAP 1560/4]
MILPLLLLTHEEGVPLPTQAFQAFLMRKILGARQARYPLHETQLVDEGMREDDACVWRGVKCENGVVTEIVWQQGMEIIKTVLYEWFPPSVERIDFENLCTHDYVETRCLPKKLRQFRAVSCALRGHFDMQTLPFLLEVLDIRHNNFSGTVYLDLLPHTIQSINLSGNRIVKAVVYNHLLPVSLRSVYLKQTNKVALQCLCMDDKNLDKRFDIWHMSP